MGLLSLKALKALAEFQSFQLQEGFIVMAFFCQSECLFIHEVGIYRINHGFQGAVDDITGSLDDAIKSVLFIQASTGRFFRFKDGFFTGPLFLGGAVLCLIKSEGISLSCHCPGCNEPSCHGPIRHRINLRVG